MTTMSKAVRKAHEHDADLLRKSIARQEESLAEALANLTAARQAKIDIARGRLAAVEQILAAEEFLSTDA